MAERLDAAFPDLEEVFSAEELLAIWGEFDLGALRAVRRGRLLERC